MSSRTSFGSNSSSSNNKENNSNSHHMPPDFLPDPKKATPSMLQSLEQLHDTLVCPLCHNMLREPSTLACAHTFCLQCIKTYSCNQSICPVKGCGIPLALTGSRQGSFLKTNPSIETVLSSLQTICKALDSAPTEWWKHAEDENWKSPVKAAAQKQSTNNNSDDEDSDSDEEMITLPIEPRKTWTAAPKDDDDNNDDDDSFGMNDSQSERVETQI